MSMDYLQHLAVQAGLRKGTDFGRDTWEDKPELDGDTVYLSMSWDGDLCRWQAWVGTESDPTSLHTSPLFDTPQEALAWLKAQADAYTHITCEYCDDKGVVEWMQGDFDRHDFCDCRIGQHKRATAGEVY